MKVTFRQSPNVLGIETGATLDTAQLPPEEAGELSRLVGDARISEAAQSETAETGPDERSIEITVEHPDGARMAVQLREARVPPQIRPLLAFLRKRATVIPNAQ
jgi:hypothetical protein